MTPASANARARWNHNIHYHDLILRAVPQFCDSVLDVGCGEGMLARELSGRARHVTAIDRDAPTIEIARRHTDVDNVDYVVADFLTHAFRPCSFAAIVSVAALHHMGTAAGLERMQELLRPGGVLAVIGLARSRGPIDLMYELAGAAGTRIHKLTKSHWESSAPTVWPPLETFSQTRRIATRILPGARYRHHILWRYSLVWTKPI